MQREWETLLGGIKCRGEDENSRHAASMTGTEIKVTIVVYVTVVLFPIWGTG